ncbi:MAG: DUF3383 domain-containing protein [Roseomonas sp.]|nr:DUF3383 domain-containing protein [Roseomonas sp.]
MVSIPASAIVSVTPGVIEAGGTALDLNGLLLTNSTQAPIGTVQSFASADDVAAYFGPSSTEAAAATLYFLGIDNSTKKPGALLFAQYPTAAVAGYLRGGSLAAMTLDDLKAVTSGTIIVTVDGATVKTSSTISLSSVTSFSNAATVITAAFTSPGFAVTYDSVASAFVFTSSSTGASSAISFATGTMSTALKLTAATGAVTSQGAAIAVPATFMSGVAAVTQNWAGFTTLFNPDSSGNTNRLALAAWTNGRGNRFWYVPWDADATPTASNAATGSLGYLIRAGNYSGTTPIWTATYDKAVIAVSYAACLDFEAENGRTTLAFRSQTGQAADVTNQTVGENLIANGYSFYGSYATANDAFTFFYNGNVSGPYAWADSYVNQIWLNNALQLAILSGLVAAKSVPYNQAGYSTIKAWCMDPINAALLYGAIRPGVTLSEAQKVAVRATAGARADETLSDLGYVLQVRDATAQVRAARGTPPCVLVYMDGQSVQSINLASILVQ